MRFVAGPAQMQGTGRDGGQTKLLNSYAVNSAATARMPIEIVYNSTDFQSEKTGSTPVGSANDFKDL